jgi:protein-tyrosine phosphatase
MTDLSEDRRLTLDGCFNFRDLGGYQAGNGVTRWRRLFRADALHGLTSDDLAHLAERGVRTILDLRSAAELERGRCPDHPALVYRHLPMMVEVPTPDESWAFPSGAAAGYMTMLSAAEDCVRIAITLVCDPGVYGCVIHCSAGKDRTGILTALLLGILGVRDQDIVDDYAASGEAMERMVAAWTAERPEARDVLEKYTPMLTAHPETMRAFLTSFRQQYGSFDGYARSIGVGEMLPELRRNIIEPHS